MREPGLSESKDKGVESGLARAKKEIGDRKSINFLGVPHFSGGFTGNPNQREEIQREIQKEMKRASQSRERRSQIAATA